MSDKWRDIPLFYGKYQASRDGKIRRVLPDGSTKILKQMPHPIGYLQVSLCGNGHPGGTKYLVHRLIAMTFLGENYEAVVNHKDGVKTHNADTNLEWITQWQNVQHYLNQKYHKEALRKARASADEEIPF